MERAYSNIRVMNNQFVLKSIVCAVCEHELWICSPISYQVWQKHWSEVYVLAIQVHYFFTSAGHRMERRAEKVFCVFGKQDAW